MWLLEVNRWMDVSTKPTKALYVSRRKAEARARKVLAPVWDQPCAMLCGSTDGVEVHRLENKTIYVYGDGWVAKVSKVEVKE